MNFKYKVCVVGGCGHVGLPLAILMANAGFKTAILDINEDALKKVASGNMPFKEENAELLLKAALKNKTFSTHLDTKVISESEYVIIIIGTPIDRHLNPKMHAFFQVMEKLVKYIRNGQTIILRSTIFPGTTALVYELMKKHKKKVKVAFCPERIAQGYAISETKNLPQIISGMDQASLESARKLFSKITSDIVELSTKEAELAKLFTNAWRYIQFATANQFFMIADQEGLDFHKILHAIKYKYPRAKDFPGSGFAAGPCLLKDTMQIASFHHNQFFLGHSAMMINEGLPDYLVSQLKRKFNLKKKTIGILGMTFKAENDDIRDSLSYKLKKLLDIDAKAVLCTDPYVKDPGFYPLEAVLKRSDIIILATPHKEYKYLKFKPKQEVIDIWNFWGKKDK